MYATLDPDGNLIATTDSLDWAIEEAGRAGWESVLLEERMPTEDPGESFGEGLADPSPERMPDLALSASGLPRLHMDEVMRMDPRETRARPTTGSSNTSRRRGCGRASASS